MLRRKLNCLYTPDRSYYGPSTLDFTFTPGGGLPAGVTFSRASTANSVVGGVFTSFAVDQPRIGDAGLIIERRPADGPARNLNRNPRLEGAVIGTPGTLPTNWSVLSAAGVVTNVVGIGVEAGLPYVDLQFVGTSTGAQYRLQMEATNGAPVAGSTGIAGSYYWKLVAGDFSNVSAIGAGWRGYTNVDGISTNGELFTTFPAVGGSILAQRPTSLGAGASTIVAAKNTFTFTGIASGAINFTIRFAGPMLENFTYSGAGRGPSSSLTLPPAGTPGASTKADDIINWPLSLFNYNPLASTIILDAYIPQGMGQGPSQNAVWLWLYRAADAGATNWWGPITRIATGDIWSSYSPSGGFASPIPGNAPIGTSLKVALSGTDGYMCAVMNGGAPQILNIPTGAGNFPAGIDTIDFGTRPNFTNSYYSSSVIKRIRYYPGVLDPSVMQSLTL